MFLSGILARGRTRVKVSHPPALIRAVRWLLVAAWMGGIFYLSQQSTPMGAEAGGVAAIPAHLGLYTSLALLLYWALAGGARPSGHSPTWTLAIVAFALTVLYGALDETHQAFVPGRVASEADLATDAAGALMGVALAILAPRLLRARDARP
jgi:hypothetical protein